MLSTQRRLNMQIRAQELAAAAAVDHASPRNGSHTHTPGTPSRHMTAAGG
jgi:hypothetical protein